MIVLIIAVCITCNAYASNDQKMIMLRNSNSPDRTMVESRECKNINETQYSGGDGSLAIVGRVAQIAASCAVLTCCLGVCFAEECATCAVHRVLASCEGCAQSGLHVVQKVHVMREELFTEKSKTT